MTAGGGERAATQPGQAAPGLGVGVVWWPELDALCRPAEGLVDVIETEPEAFWTRAPDGTRRSALAGALVHLPQPKLLHGIGAPLGGTVQAPAGHLDLFRQEITALAPRHVSEHLSFSHFSARPGDPPVFANFFLPPLQGEAGVQLAVGNIAARRAALGDVPLAVETPVSYLPTLPGEWPDGAFVGEVARRAQCGILLDLHNILCNARNGREAAADFIAALPPERVWELHLGGGEWLGDTWLDAHSGVADEEQMELAEWLVPRLPALSAIIFEIMPEQVTQTKLSEVARMLGRLRAIWATRGTTAASVEPVAGQPGEPPCDPALWEALLGSAATGRPAPPVCGALGGWWRAAEDRRALYRRLASEGRASALAAAAPNTVRALLATDGPEPVRRLLAKFWQASPASPLAMEEAECFFRFVAGRTTDVAGLQAAMAEDAAAMALG